MTKAIYLMMLDESIRNLNDEHILDYWFTYGVPDGSDEIDFEELAKDDELYEDCLQTYSKCLKKAFDKYGKK